MTQSEQGGGEWRTWVGGKCPVDGATRVEVKTRNQRILDLRAWQCDWDIAGQRDDIIAYRVILA